MKLLTVKEVAKILKLICNLKKDGYITQDEFEEAKIRIFK